MSFLLRPAGAEIRGGHVYHLMRHSGFTVAKEKSDAHNKTWTHYVYFVSQSQTQSVNLRSEDEAITGANAQVFEGLAKWLDIEYKSQIENHTGKVNASTLELEEQISAEERERRAKLAEENRQREVTTTALSEEMSLPRCLLFGFLPCLLYCCGSCPACLWWRAHVFDGPACSGHPAWCPLQAS